MKIKSCDTPDAQKDCKLADFQSFMEKNFILSDDQMAEQCGTKSAVKTEKRFWFWVAMIVIALFMVQLSLFFCYYSKNSSNNDRVRLEDNFNAEGMGINDKLVREQSSSS